jgi:hypothetical protein
VLCVSHSVVHRAPAPAAPGSLFKMKILGSTPDMQNQDLRAWSKHPGVQ